MVAVVKGLVCWVGGVYQFLTRPTGLYTPELRLYDEDMALVTHLNKRISKGHCWSNHSRRRFRSSLSPVWALPPFLTLALIILNARTYGQQIGLSSVTTTDSVSTAPAQSRSPRRTRCSAAANAGRHNCSGRHWPGIKRDQVKPGPCFQKAAKANSRPHAQLPGG